MKTEYQHQNPASTQSDWNIAGTIAVIMPTKTSLKEHINTSILEPYMVALGLAVCSEPNYVKKTGREVSSNNMDFIKVETQKVTFPFPGKSLIHFNTMVTKFGKTYYVGFGLSFTETTDYVRLEYGFIS